MIVFTTDFNADDLQQCVRCGAVTSNVELHAKWHEDLKGVADRANMGFPVTFGEVF